MIISIQLKVVWIFRTENNKESGEVNIFYHR